MHLSNQTASLNPKQTLNKILTSKVLFVAIALIAASLAAIAVPAFARSQRSAHKPTRHKPTQKHLRDYTQNPSYPSKTKDSELDAQLALVTIPGTSISLRPPDGFVLSEQFSGFENRETSSSIVLAELPAAAYPEISATFSSSAEDISTAFAQQSIILEVESISSLLVGNTQVPFVEGIQTVGSAKIKKYFALLEGESTILLTFNIIDTAQTKRETIVETVESVVISSAPTIQQKIDELPFTVIAADPFQVLDVLAGSSVVLSINGEPDPTEETPLVIIASSFSPVQTTNIASLSTQLLQSTAGFETSTITSQSPAPFAGSEGYLMQASLEDKTILQYLTLLPDDFYIRMVVISPSERLDAIMPAIQTIQNSVTIKE